LEIENTVNSH